MGYLSRLGRDLDRWIDQGWVEAGNRDAILGDAAARSRHWTATGALTILGAVLLALSALTFVAANWECMPRLARFGVILLPLWASLAGAGQAFDRKSPALGHALAVLAVGLFGVAIVLTAQTFNMASFRNTAVLIWSLAGLVTALALPSRPVLILSALLGGLWAGLEFFNPHYDGALWSYLPLWLASLALAIRLESRVTIHLLGFALILWAGHALLVYREKTELEPAILASLAILIYGVLTLAGAVMRDRGLAGGGILAGWMAAVTAGLAVLAQNHIDDGITHGAGAAAGLYLPLALPALAGLAGLLAWRVRDGRMTGRSAAGLGAAALTIFALPFVLGTGIDGFGLQLVMGTLLYTASVILILQGSQTGSRAIGAIGICTFIGQTLYVYIQTFGGLLDTALFFLVGGLILFALGYGLMRWQARQALMTSGGHS